MKAWIVHYQNIYNDAKHTRNTYTAWSSEKQAQKSASEYIVDICKKYGSMYKALPAISNAINTLLDCNKFDEAFRLFNEYARFPSFRYGSEPSEEPVYEKHVIVIQESKFLGHVLD